MKSILSIAIATLVSFLVCNSLAIASRGLARTLHCRTIDSASGIYTMKIDPSELDGSGPARYTLSQNGTELWTRDFPFTLFEAWLTDSGTLLGTAYTHGEEGMGLDEGSPGFLVVAMIDSQGTVLLQDRIARAESRYIHGLPTPRTKGMVVDEAHNRMIVRVDADSKDGTIGRKNELWKVYSLSSAKELDEVDTRFADSSILHVQSIRDTDLLLVQTWTYNTKKSGSVYHVCDVEGESLWSLKMPHDFNNADETLEDALRQTVWKKGTIYQGSTPKSFEIQFVTNSERVSFSVSQPYRGQAIVQEVSRKRFEYPVNDKPALPDLPTMDLKYLGPIRLKSKTISPINSIRNIEAGFDFEPSNAANQLGNIGFIRKEKATPDTFVVVTPTGELVAEIPIHGEMLAKGRWTGTASVGRNRFVITQSQWGIGGKSRAWRIDVTDRSCKILENFSAPSVEALSGFLDGGFVALCKEQFKYTMSDSLLCFDKNGDRIWTIEEDSQEPTKLFSPESITISSDEDILVLDNVRKSVQVFDRNGRYVRTFNLEELWGRKPNYLTNIAKGANGGFVVYDFRREPSLVEMNEYGEVLRSLNCRKTASLPNVYPLGNMCTDAQGHIWMADRDNIMRISDQGLVDVQLGEVPNSKEMGDVGFVDLSHDGDVFAMSRKTGAIHVFGKQGEFKNSFHDPKLNDQQYHSNPLRINRAKEVFAFYGESSIDSSQYIQFSANGKKLNEHKLNGKDACFLPNGNRVEVGYQEIQLTDRNGAHLLTIKRQPDERWLSRTGDVSVAPDGSFALLAEHSKESIPPVPSSVNLYDADGKPIRTIALPQLHLSRISYDGQSIVVTYDDGVLLYTAIGKQIGFFRPTQFSKDKPYLYPHLIEGELVLSDGNNRPELQRFSFSSALSLGPSE